MLDDKPATEVSPAKRRRSTRDLRPYVIGVVAICYSLTVTIASITVVNVNGASVARACIENGGEWVINDGTRECRR